MTLTRAVIIESIRRLWPRRRLYKGCLVPDAERFDDEYLANWFDSCNSDATSFEQFVNHVHLPDLIIDLDDQAETTVDELKLIMDSYVALLKFEIERVVPGRPYEISITGDIDHVPVVDFPDGRRDRLVAASNVEITCWLKR